MAATPIRMATRYIGPPTPPQARHHREPLPSVVMAATASASTIAVLAHATVASAHGCARPRKQVWQSAAHGRAAGGAVTARSKPAPPVFPSFCRSLRSQREAETGDAAKLRERKVDEMARTLPLRRRQANRNESLSQVSDLPHRHRDIAPGQKAIRLYGQPLPQLQVIAASLRRPLSSCGPAYLLTSCTPCDLRSVS